MRKNRFFLMVVSAIFCLNFAALAQAQVVKNAYYSLDLGDEWEQPNGDKLQNNNYSTYYTNKSHDTAIYISINEVKMTADQIAKTTAEQMKAAGAEVQDIQIKGDTHFFDYSIHEGKGKYFFRTIPNGYAAISIFGSQISDAEELIKRIQPYGDSVIPNM